jgi:hypothetical protein
MNRSGRRGGGRRRLRSRRGLEDVTAAAQQQADAPVPYVGLALFTLEDADRFSVGSG